MTWVGRKSSWIRWDDLGGRIVTRGVIGSRRESGAVVVPNDNSSLAFVNLGISYAESSSASAPASGSAGAAS